MLNKLLFFFSVIACALISSLIAETTIKETFMIPMRDGIQLATDVIRPLDANTHSVLLHRTPYGKSDLPVPELAVMLLNLKGYALVIQDTRGRYASQGADSVFFTDGWGAQQDGFDTIEWLVKQSWCNGKVALFGASASGITTYRAVGSLHPAIKCAVAIVAATDFYHQFVFPGGEYGRALCNGWIDGQGSLYMIEYLLQRPYYSAEWEYMNLHSRTDSIRVPMIHIGGWYDCFSSGPVAAFTDLQRYAAIPQKLIMGPWTHHSTGSSAAVGQLTYSDAAVDILSIAVNWFDHWLLDIANDAEKMPAVHYYLMGDPNQPEDGGGVWLDAETWPPPEAQPVKYYLAAANSLALQKPSVENSISYTYDPANPVPTIGGNNLNIANGPRDQRTVTSRADVLCYSTDVLAEPLRVEGYVTATIFVAGNQPDTDFTLKLMDVYPDGREMLVVDGIQRARFRHGYFASLLAWLLPDQVEPITVSLPPTALVFGKNHRIKIAVSSSNYPRFETNLNTAAEPYVRTETRVAVNTVFTGGDHASYVVLPVMRPASLVQQSMVQPQQFRLLPAFPNPFNSATRLRYHLQAPAEVQLDVYSVTGALVQRLQRGRQNSGEHTLTWSGCDHNGIPMPSGMYLIALTINQHRQTQKLLLVR